MDRHTCTPMHCQPGPAHPQGRALAHVCTHTPGHRISLTSRLPRPAGCSCQAPVCLQGVRERLSTPGHTPGLVVPAGGILSPQGDIPQFGRTKHGFGAAAETGGTRSVWHTMPVPLGFSTWQNSGDWAVAQLQCPQHRPGKLKDNSGQAQGRGQQCRYKARAAPGR